MSESKIKLNSTINLDLKITLTLTVGEAHALNEITKYGAKSFLEGYYKQLGKSYLQPYEKSVHSLFDTIKQNMPYRLSEAKDIIEAVNKLKK